MQVSYLNCMKMILSSILKTLSTNPIIVRRNISLIISGLLRFMIETDYSSSNNNNISNNDQTIENMTNDITCKLIAYKFYNALVKWDKVNWIITVTTTAILTTTTMQ